MKLNRKWLLVIALVLSMTMAISGTLAYLTDSDAQVNVMTLGSVKIQQNEYQRVIGDDGLETSELEPFEQGKAMMPYTDRDPKPGNTTFTVGEHSVTQDRAKANYVDKIVSVTNTGKSDAYVRTILAIPSGGSAWEPTDTAASDTWIHWNTKKAMNDYWHSQWTDSAKYDGFFAEIDGQGYFIYEFTHKTAIEPGYETFPTLVGCYMDKRVNHDDTGYYMDYNTNGMYDDGDKRIEDLKLGGTVEIMVLSQAVQAAGFADPQTALDESFGDVTADNAQKWFGGMEASKPVSTAAELADALKAGESVVLTENITVEAIDIPAGTTATINLNGKTLTGAAYTTDSGADSLNNVVNNSGDLTITGEGKIRTRNLKNNAGANLVIDGNIEIIGGASGGGSAIWNEGNCTINGATISQTNDWNYAVQNIGTATMKITNATVSANHGAISNTSTGTLTIEDGSYTCLASGHVVYVTAGNVTINGGFFKHSQQNATSEGNVVIYANSGSVTVNGGTFDSVSAAFAYNNQIGNITFNNGTKLNEAQKNY